MKKWKHGFVLLLLCIGYGLISLYSAYVGLQKLVEKREKGPTKDVEVRGKESIVHADDDQMSKEFAIWDTCGLGIYLWRNILEGEITKYNLNNGWLQSSLEIKDFIIKYNLGYGLTPDQALIPSQPNIVLIINRRADELVPKAKAWLDHVLKSAYIDNIAVMLLGSETCDNDWILPYLNQKRIKCVFLVYDSPLVDDDFVFQWPLGVASYRNFQNFNKEFLDLTANRKFVFNFVGTVYDGSSRVQMIDAVNKLSNRTKRYRYIKTRDNWVPEEDAASMADYQHILMQSDLTLSPTGRNSECYRTYEAIEMGSIPVIEDIVTEGTCDTNSSSPYRLLKRYNAPVMFVKDWEKELPGIVEEFGDLPLRAKVRSRINLLRWYVDFKIAMRDRFLNVIRLKFFGAN